MVHLIRESSFAQSHTQGRGVIAGSDYRFPICNQSGLRVRLANSVDVLGGGDSYMSMLSKEPNRRQRQGEI
jgi:hypothetical protein